MNRSSASFVLGLTLALGAPTLWAAPVVPQAAPPKSPPALQPPPPPRRRPPIRLRRNSKKPLTGSTKATKAGASKLLEGMRQDPAVTPPVLSLLGALYLRTNRPKEALAILKPLADAPDADPAVLFNAGRAALAVGQKNEGMEYFEHSVALAPGSPASRTLGLILAREGEPGHAYEVLRPWVAATPNDTEARLAAALLAVNLQR